MEKNLLSNTKKAITLAAMDLFSRHGYAPVSMDDIAAKSNLSKPAIYHHFKNKEALYLAVLEKLHEEYMSKIKHIMQENFSAREKFRQIVFSFLALKNYAGENNCACSNMILLQPMSMEEKDIMDYVQKTHSEVFDCVRPLVDELAVANPLFKDSDPLLLFILIHGAMNAFVMDQSFIKTKNWSDEQVVDHLCRLVFKD
jgi:AcrR family transcriptional regulator